ncbi:MAG: hypothetical protein V3V32_04295 [Dehalococcoidia bacterium]
MKYFHRLACRVLGHSVYRVVDIKDAQDGVALTALCNRCGDPMTLVLSEHQWLYVQLCILSGDKSVVKL